MNQEYTADVSGVFALVECSMCQIFTNTSSSFEGLACIYHLFVLFPHLLTLTGNLAFCRKTLSSFPDVKSSSLIKREKNSL